MTLGTTQLPRQFQIIVMTLERIQAVSHGASNSFAAGDQLSAATSPNTNNAPDILNDLRSRALHLRAAALQWAGTTPQQREQTEALVCWADALQGSAKIDANNLKGFEYAMNELPEWLRRAAGHSAALQADRDEFRRLQAALNGAAKHLPGKEFASLSTNAKRTEGLFHAADQALKAGHGQELQDHVAHIRGRIASLRGLLELKKIVRHEDRLPEKQHPDPAPFPATRQDKPISGLNDSRSVGKTEEAERRRVADVLKGARNLLVHRRANPATS